MGMLLKLLLMTRDTHQNDDTDLALAPFFICPQIFRGWLSPGVEIRVIVRAETLRHGRLRTAEVRCGKASQGTTAHLQEPVGRLHAVGKGDGFTQDCWYVDGHFGVLRIDSGYRY